MQSSLPSNTKLMSDSGTEFDIIRSLKLQVRGYLFYLPLKRGSLINQRFYYKYYQYFQFRIESNIIPPYPSSKQSNKEKSAQLERNLISSLPQAVQLALIFDKRKEKRHVFARK